MYYRVTYRWATLKGLIKNNQILVEATTKDQALKAAEPKIQALIGTKDRWFKIIEAHEA